MSAGGEPPDPQGAMVINVASAWPRAPMTTAVLPRVR